MDVKEETILAGAFIPINWWWLTILDARFPDLQAEGIGRVRIFSNWSVCVTLPNRNALRTESQLRSSLDGRSVGFRMSWSAESKVPNGRLSVSNVLERVELVGAVVRESLMEFL